MSKLTIRPVSALIVAALLSAGSAWANDPTAMDQAAATASTVISSTETALSDAAITTKIKAALWTEKGLKSTRINVSTKSGKVALTGSVPEQKQAWRANEIAAETKGVSVVDNQLTIRAKKGATGEMAEYLSDAAITSKIKAELLLTKDMPGIAINVKTEEGRVVLAGSVANKAQAKRAVEIAKQVKDVKDVKNQLKLK